MPVFGSFFHTEVHKLVTSKLFVPKSLLFSSLISSFIQNTQCARLRPCGGVLATLACPKSRVSPVCRLIILSAVLTGLYLRRSFIFQAVLNGKKLLASLPFSYAGSMGAVLPSKIFLRQIMLGALWAFQGAQVDVRHPLSQGH